MLFSGCADFKGSTLADNSSKEKEDLETASPKKYLLYFVSTALLRPYALSMPENRWMNTSLTPILAAKSQQCCPPADPKMTKASGMPKVSNFLVDLAISSLAISMNPSAISYIDFLYVFPSLICSANFSKFLMDAYLLRLSFLFFPNILGK